MCNSEVFLSTTESFFFYICNWGSTSWECDLICAVAMHKQQENWATSPQGEVICCFPVCSQRFKRDQLKKKKRATAPLVVYQRIEGRNEVNEVNLACWLTRQCEGPWWMRMRTMSTSPRQAARCRGKHPLLSSTFVEASYCSSFSTTSLRQTHAHQ